MINKILATLFRCSHVLLLLAITAASANAKPAVKAGSLVKARLGPIAVLPAIAATDAEMATLPNAPNALGNYNLLIADRGNNRIILINWAKKILWEHEFTGINPGSGADDAFFSKDGKSIIVNLEYQHVIQIIDVQTQQVTWQYGEMGKAGSKDGRLNRPDDAYLLPNGDAMVADIRNCRVLEIAPDKHIVRQYGAKDYCDSKPGDLASPNGDTPLPNGHILISTVRDRLLHELDENWQPVFQLHLPLHYPSDPQPTLAGNFLIADYSRSGKVIEISREGDVVWEYKAKNDDGLRRPSLAKELPNGNILINDDFNHRVIIVDKATQKILWQYGFTHKQGSGRGYLSIPDGMDIIKTD